MSSRADVQGFAADGAVGVLVGESLMRAASPAALIRELLGQPAARALCKVCGLRTPEAILAATEAGADLLGMIFVPGAKRTITEEEAAHMVREVRRLRPRAADWRPPRFEATEAGSKDEGEEGAARWLQLWRGLLARGAQAGGPLTVGVFVDASAEEINRAAEAVGLDLVQLHGKSEGWEIAKQLRVPAVRVVHMADPNPSINPDPNPNPDPDPNPNPNPPPAQGRAPRTALDDVLRAGAPPAARGRSRPAHPCGARGRRGRRGRRLLRRRVSGNDARLHLRRGERGGRWRDLPGPGAGGAVHRSARACGRPARWGAGRDSGHASARTTLTPHPLTSNPNPEPRTMTPDP